MNLPYTAPKWVDAKLKVPRPVGPPIFSSPLPNTSAKFLLRQEIEQNINDFTPLAFNTRHPNYPTYVLVNEGDFEDSSGGVVRWVRTYAQVPTSYSDKRSFGYQFIGARYTTSSPPPIWPTVYVRDPYSRRVQSRIGYDFFLVGQTLTPAADDYGAGVADANASTTGPGTVAAPYDSDGSIPFLYAMIYIDQANASGVWYGGLSWTAQYLTETTVPTAATYQKMCNDANANGWNSTVSAQKFTVINPAQTIVNPQASDTPATPTPNSVYGGQICAEDSDMDRWMGNIFLRKTRYVLAE
jgi:hypothetical protein